MATYMRGLDYFITDPGEADTMACAVCGATCVVHRDADGSTCLARRSTTHDAFACPHTSEAWHQKARDLRLAMSRTSSKQVASRMHQDLSAILNQHPARN